MPEVLKRAMEKQLAGISQKELFKNSKDLSIKYRENKVGGKHLLNGYNEALAYSIVRMPATYGAVYQALKYSLDHIKCSPLSLLDVGAGTGAASWAASSLIDLNEITCLEREEAMINIGKNLMKEASLSNAKWIKHDLVSENIDQKADIVIASYVLNEIYEKERLNLLEKLWNAANMMLLIVEPGTSIAFSQMKKTRDFFIKKSAYILAPCTHELECKMEKEQWCHFSCRIPRSRIHKKLKDGDAPYEDEKFTYLALSHDKYERAKERILRHPFVEKGKITLDTCSEEGIKKNVISKKDGDFYRYAKKSKWGDEI